MSSYLWDLFPRDIDRKRFTDLLVTLEDNVPTKKTVDFIFDSMIGDSFQLKRHQELKYPSFIDVLAQLLPFCSLSNQTLILSNLMILVENTINLDICCSHGLWTSLLTCLPRIHDQCLDKTLKLLIIIGRHSFSQKDYHFLLNTMYSMICEDPLGTKKSMDDSNLPKDDGTPSSHEVISNLDGSNDNITGDTNGSHDFPTTPDMIDSAPSFLSCTRTTPFEPNPRLLYHMLNTLLEIITQSNSYDPTPSMDPSFVSNTSPLDNIFVPSPWNSSIPLKPSSLIYFNGRDHCSLMLPSFDLNVYGYSFSFWVRLEYIQPKKHEQRMFQLLNEQGNGLTFSWMPQGGTHLFLCVHSIHFDEKKSFIFDSFSFKKGYWYHISITHIPKMFGRDEMKLNVYGSEWYQSKNIPYFSKNHRRMTLSSIGSDRYASSFEHYLKCPTFYGQMAYFLFFNEPMHQDKLTKVYRMNLDVHQIQEEIQKSQTLFFIHPNEYNEKLCFNKVRKNGPASRVGSIRISKTTPIHEAINQYGGIKSMFIILEKAMKKVKKGSKKHKKGNSLDSTNVVLDSLEVVQDPLDMGYENRTDSSLTPHSSVHTSDALNLDPLSSDSSVLSKYPILSLIFRIIYILSRCSLKIVLDMIHSNAIPSLSMLLEKMDPVYLDSNLLMEIENMIDGLEEDLNNPLYLQDWNAIGYGEIHGIGSISSIHGNKNTFKLLKDMKEFFLETIYKDILWNIRIWKHASYIMKKQLYIFLKKYTSQRTERIRRIINLNEMVETLRYELKYKRREEKEEEKEESKQEEKTPIQNESFGSKEVLNRNKDDTLNRNTQDDSIDISSGTTMTSKDDSIEKDLSIECDSDESDTSIENTSSSSSSEDEDDTLILKGIEIINPTSKKNIQLRSSSSSAIVLKLSPSATALHHSFSLVKELRSQWFQMMYHYLDSYLNRDHLDILISYLKEPELDSIETIEILQFMLRLFQSSSKSQDLWILYHPPFKAVYSLLLNEDEDVRVACMDLITYMMYHKMNVTERDKFLESTLYNLLDTMIRRYRFTYKTYQCILKMSVDESIESSDLVSGMEIKVPSLLPYLFQLLEGAEWKLKLEMMEHYTILFASSRKGSKNSQTLAQMDDIWMHYYIGVWVEIKKNEYEERKREERREKREERREKGEEELLGEEYNEDILIEEGTHMEEKESHTSNTSLISTTLYSSNTIHLSSSNPLSSSSIPSSPRSSLLLLGLKDMMISWMSEFIHQMLLTVRDGWKWMERFDSILKYYVYHHEHSEDGFKPFLYEDCLYIMRTIYDHLLTRVSMDITQYTRYHLDDDRIGYDKEGRTYVSSTSDIMSQRRGSVTERSRSNTLDGCPTKQTQSGSHTSSSYYGSSPSSEYGPYSTPTLNTQSSADAAASLLWENLAPFMVLLEEYLFYSPYDLNTLKLYEKTFEKNKKHLVKHLHRRDDKEEKKKREEDIRREKDHYESIRKDKDHYESSALKESSEPYEYKESMDMDDNGSMGDDSLDSYPSHLQSPIPMGRKNLIASKDKQEMNKGIERNKEDLSMEYQSKEDPLRKDAPKKDTSSITIDSSFNNESLDPDFDEFVFIEKNDPMDIHSSSHEGIKKTHKVKSHNDKVPNIQSHHDIHHVDLHSTHPTSLSSHASYLPKRQWDDLDICLKAIELFDLILRPPYLDWILKVDLTRHFGKEKHDLLLLLLRLILLCIQEGKRSISLQVMRESKSKAVHELMDIMENKMVPNMEHGWKENIQKTVENMYMNPYEKRGEGREEEKIANVKMEKKDHPSNKTDPTSNKIDPDYMSDPNYMNDPSLMIDSSSHSSFLDRLFPFISLNLDRLERILREIIHRDDIKKKGGYKPTRIMGNIAQTIASNVIQSTSLIYNNKTSKEIKRLDIYYYIITQIIKMYKEHYHDPNDDIKNMFKSQLIKVIRKMEDEDHCFKKMAIKKEMEEKPKEEEEEEEEEIEGEYKEKEMLRGEDKEKEMLKGEHMTSPKNSTPSTLSSSVYTSSSSVSTSTSSSSISTSSSSTSLPDSVPLSLSPHFVTLLDFWLDMMILKDPSSSFITRSLSKSMSKIEYGLIQSIFYLKERRDKTFVALSDKKYNRDLKVQRGIENMENEHNRLLQKIQYHHQGGIMSRHRVHRLEHLFLKKEWKQYLLQMNDVHGSYKGVLLHETRTIKGEPFIKLDKTEQKMRIRKKVKKNIKGTRHEKSSFTFLRKKWAKEIEDRKKKEEEKKRRKEEEEEERRKVLEEERKRRRRELKEKREREEREGKLNENKLKVIKDPLLCNDYGIEEGNRDEEGNRGEDVIIEDRKKESSMDSTSSSSKTSKPTSSLSESMPSQSVSNPPQSSLSSHHPSLASSLDDFEIVPSEFNEDDHFQLDDSVVFSSKCELIMPEMVVFGRLEITSSGLFFFHDHTLNHFSSSSKSLDHIPKKELSYQKWIHKMFRHKIRDRYWPLDSLISIFSRRYLLNWTALELFFSNHRSFFFNFPKDVSYDAFRKILSLKPIHLVDSFYGHSIDLMKRRSDLTDKWKRREISNFEYLMHLNILSGRTYNDLTQYPIFPWILTNYSSEDLDLSDPSNFRDLSKPIGALDPVRLEKFKDRYESLLMDDTTPPFHYGSHYSSAGAVLYYLIRMEPFTSQFICLQGGKFDYPDRQFASIMDAFQNCMRSTTDVKELIPEFFFLPEFLLNHNGFDLGSKSETQDIIDHVVLPPWASSSEDFIRIHREALESEYVSQHLHLWIDLIFGEKQRGKKAAESFNTFYYLTYEGAVDIHELSNPVMKQSILSQIENFGQTPAQIFKRPHPQRDLPRSNSEIFSSIFMVHDSLFSHTTQGTRLLPFNAPFYLHTAKNDKTLWTLNEFGELLIHRYDIRLHPKDGDMPISFEMDSNFNESMSLVNVPTEAKNKVQRMRMLDLMANIMRNRNRCVPFHDLNKRKRIIMHPEDPKILITFGYYDGSIQTYRLDDWNGNQLKCQQRIQANTVKVDCLDISMNYMISGSEDASCTLWRCDYKKRDGFKILYPLYHITCHYHPISCLAISREWDIIVTCSTDGFMAIHHLNVSRNETRTFIRHKGAIHLLKISTEGFIIAYCKENRTLYRYSINGDLAAIKNIYQENEETIIERMEITKSGRFLITAGAYRVTVRRVYDLEVIYDYQEVTSKIIDIALGDDERILFVSLEDGNLIMYFKPDGSKLYY